MSDRESLLCVLVALYLVECLFWVKRGGVVFRTWLGRRWGYVPDGELARNDHGGLHWSWPLPPLGEVLVCRGFPFSFGPQGILAFKSECLHSNGRPQQSGRLVRWDDIHSISVSGKKLLVNGELFWSGDSVHSPWMAAEWLKMVTPLPADQRLAKLEESLSRSYDRSAFKSRLSELRTQIGWLNRWCTCFLIYIFGVVPWVVSRFDWLPALYWLVPAMLVQTGWIAFRFVRAHRQLFPGATEERFKLGLIYALAPAGSSRACDPLTRGALEAFHPWCAAAELLTPTEFERLARGAWRDLNFPRFPECVSGEPDAIAIEAWFRKRSLQALESLLTEIGLDSADWLRPPQATEGSHTQYCPRCHAQFTADAGTCSECGGRPLLPLHGFSMKP